MPLHPLVLAVSEHRARLSQVNRYGAYSRLALMFYDMVLNIGREKRLVWDTKFRASSVVYLCVRYPLIAFQVFQVCWTPSTPQTDSSTWGIALIPTRIAICISFVLRVYAVTGGGKFFAGILTLISLLIIGLDIRRIMYRSSRYPMYVTLPITFLPISPLSVCTPFSHRSPNLAIPFISLFIHSPPPLLFSRPASVLTFISLIVFDVLTTAVISWRLVRVIRNSGGISNLTGGSMVGLVMRSGVLYFNVMTTIQLGAVILYFHRDKMTPTRRTDPATPGALISSPLTLLTPHPSPTTSQGVYSNLLNNYTLLLSSVLTARFLLDLRAMADAAADPPVRTRDQNLASMKFGANPNPDSNTTDSSAWGGAGLVRDFEDNLSYGEVDGWGTNSLGWPMEDLAERARRTEERLAEGEV
ncbi:hypothetical protein NEOLEDRAFT_1181902 [Neolentinus lepideus HHB14362 ss-1]|uniref:DUF6533 domain-containing protein n=1 Tax=Neolentinus lepideus HHB14362 ss-1 TaxID=1314782 RepID=A0A165PJJ7_9AGAM|nr:hypothetical protein NEOLEDRAFT_1181902 [Neolentinus lepideus HHB14362 ss-1]